MIVGYRIYPSWFRDFYSREHSPMAEMVEGAATRMGCLVDGIEIVGTGNDRGGQFIDFDVTYISTDVMKEAK